MGTETQVTLHEAAAVAEALERLASHILKVGDLPVLVGIHTNGVPLAERLVSLVEKLAGERPELGTLDITLYRDDLGERTLPEVRGSTIPFDVSGRRVVLVDDVLFTGRTVRAALNVLGDFGRPQRVELCVLVDRGHRELPIHADFCGFTIETEPEDVVTVELVETGGTDRITLSKGQRP